MFQEKCVINLSDKHQHIRPGFHSEPAGISDFAQNRKICIVDHLKFIFGKAWKTLREGKKLCISFKKPYAAVSRNNFARWVKDIIQQAGVHS